jgi:glyoxylase-like metal-dependent hydrolase (beta-lactamase superfamily II)
MHIYHLNCGSLYSRFPRAHAIIYCLLVETNQGLVLVDTGFGLNDYPMPSKRMRLFLFLMGVPCKVEETAAHHIAKLGFDIEDVHHIVLTHLHFDHAGGLRDFPSAKVHVYRPEYEAAMNPRGLIELAYDSAHWAHDPTWVFHDQIDGDWFGFECIHVIDGLVPEILFVPLPGHTRGHCGVAIETPTGWLFQCGDAASPFHRETDLHDRERALQHANILPGRFARRVIGPHVPRLRKLADEHRDKVKVISSHDIYSFSEFQTAESV